MIGEGERVRRDSFSLLSFPLLSFPPPQGGKKRFGWYSRKRYEQDLEIIGVAAIHPLYYNPSLLPFPPLTGYGM